MIVKRIKAPHVLAALVLTMTGCEYLGPQIHTKLPLPEVNPAEEGELQPQPELEKKTTMVELYPNGEPSISQQPAGTPSEMGGGKKSGKGEYSLNFDDADLGEVAKVILSDILGKNYTISPQVTGKVTLQTTSPLTKEELMPTLDMLLSVNNAALVNQGGMYLIKPATEAVYGSPVRSMPNGYQTRVIPIRNVSAGDVAEILKPLLPEKALLQADTSRNILLVAGSGAELSRVMELVRIFDVDMLRGRSFGLFTPAHVDASKIIEELDEIFNAKKSKEGDSFFKFIEIDRMNAVLAITHKASYLQDIESWVKRLDRTNAEAGGGVHVYKAQNVSADELADTLNEIFGTGGGGRSRGASIASGRRAASASNRSGSSGFGSSSSGFGSSSGGIGSSSSGMSSGIGMGASISGVGADRKAASGGGTDASVGSSGGAGNTSGGMGGGQIFESNVKIVADEGNNALVIVANSEDYAKILPVLKALDVLPLQVIIDATIVEVTLNDDLKYGIEWFFSHNNGGTNKILGGTGTGLDLLQTGEDAFKGLATGGFSYAFSSGSKDIQAILNASAKNNNVNVISSPSLMVQNNQEAQIRVGDSVPIRSAVSTPLTGGTGVNNNPIQTSSIQMVDTGVMLTVKPRVNAGGLVLMDLRQSVNRPVKTTTSDTIDSPTIQKREIESSVAVQSGETIVLGGLISENNDYLRDGVPFLHEIPLIGPLFGGTTRNKDKTELVVLLTPRVMKSRQDAQDMTEEFKRKLTGIYEERTSVDMSVQ